MKIITPGHCYDLENFLNANSTDQRIQFVQKVPAAEGSVVVVNGTTNEEVLAMLIDRLGHLNGKFPCRENSIAITHIETALLWLNKRTSDRLKRGVEGQHKA